jgi:hypothetical protein
MSTSIKSQSRRRPSERQAELWLMPWPRFAGVDVMADPRPGGSGPIEEAKRLAAQMLRAADALEKWTEGLQKSSAQLLVQVERLRHEAAPLLIQEREAPDEH